MLLAFDPREHLLVFVRRVVVQHDVNLLFLGDCLLNLSQKPQHLLVSMLAIGLADHLSPVAMFNAANNVVVP